MGKPAQGCFQVRPVEECGLFLRVIIYRINEDAVFHCVMLVINTDCELIAGMACVTFSLLALLKS